MPKTTSQQKLTHQISMRNSDRYFKGLLSIFPVSRNKSSKVSTHSVLFIQVQHLFTDKTGTLTENNLEFRQLSAGGIKYVDQESNLCLLPSQKCDAPKPVRHKPVSSFIIYIRCLQQYFTYNFRLAMIQFRNQYEINTYGVYTVK